MRRRKKIYQEETGLDLTPMLDIVFIMLIFFIVTTSFVKESGIEVNRPNAETAERNEKGNILVAISENNEIYIDRRKVELRAIRPNIIRLRAENPEGAVIIQADKASQTGLLVEAMDQIRLAGVLEISIGAEIDLKILRSSHWFFVINCVFYDSKIFSDKQGIKENIAHNEATAANLGLQTLMRPSGPKSKAAPAVAQVTHANIRHAAAGVASGEFDVP